MTYSTLGSIVKQVIETKQDHNVTKQEQHKIQYEFYVEVSPFIQKLRDEQRQALEESKNFTLR